MQGTSDSQLEPNESVPASGAAEQVLADLMALPLDAFLHSWQRFSWWSGILPLFQHMAALNLTLPDVVVLGLVARRACNVAEVGQCIALSPSAASRAVDRLVDAGLIDRQEDPDDRRHKRLTLTPEGAARIAEVEQAFGGEFAGLVVTLSPAEQEHLRALLARLLAAFVGHGGCAKLHVTGHRSSGSPTGGLDHPASVDDAFLEEGR